MNKDFDMDEVFQYLVEEDHSTVSLPAWLACFVWHHRQAHILNRALLYDERQQRSLIFKFDYFTVVGYGVQPMPWQRSDGPEQLHDKPPDHVPISRCSSVVALSLSGGYLRKFRNYPAGRNVTQYGYVYDPWEPVSLEKGPNSDLKRRVTCATADNWISGMCSIYNVMRTTNTAWTFITRVRNTLMAQRHSCILFLPSSRTLKVDSRISIRR